MNEIFLLSTHPVHFFNLRLSPSVADKTNCCGQTLHALSNLRASKLPCQVKLKSLTEGRVTFTYQEYLTWFKSLCQQCDCTAEHNSWLVDTKGLTFTT